MNGGRSNSALEKSYTLALAAIRISISLQKNGEYVLSRQLVRSGTSIGANVEEAQSALSKADFRNKMYIAAKETRETLYWIRLLRDSSLIPKDIAEEILNQADEVKRLLTAITKTVSNK
jgi:four helix bundle protein